VSDLHVGARDDPILERALHRLVEETAPGLVVASGDLTHRGRADEHARAAALLRSLGTPLLVVPGNHDIPHSLPARLATPWARFEHEWQTTEPVHAAAFAHVVGVNSVRPWRHQSGAVADDALARVEARLAESAPGALRVVALHHQLTGAPWRTRKRPVANRTHVLARLVDAGADLVVSGHIHQAAVSERHEFEVVEGEARSVVVAVAPGLGQPRPSRRGEARGALVYLVEDAMLGVETHIWQGDGFRVTASRSFARR
jgi:3',5'-cyclic AMP phosphodiesterase CpdA